MRKQIPLYYILGWFVGFHKWGVKPFLQFDFNENIEPDKGDQIGQVPSEFCCCLHDFEQKDGDQCRPYLDHYRIFGGPDKGFNMQ